MSMKVVLLNPMSPKQSFDDSNDQLPPLGLLSVATAVRDRHDVQVLDGELQKLTGDNLLDRIQGEPDMIGIGGTTCTAVEAAVLATRSRERFPRAKIFAGGVHATIVREGILSQCPAFDAVIYGPGEYPFAAMADGMPLEQVPQAIYRKGNGFASQPLGKELDLATLPLPARDLVNIHHYHGATHRVFQQTVIMATRGCPFQCTFCSNSLWGRRWRHRPIDSTLLELGLLANMGFREVFFQDDTMNVDPQWAEELFHAIAGAKLGLEYKVAFRANEKLLTEPMLDAAAEAGVREIFYGVESGNEAIREATGKGLCRQEIIQAVRQTRQRGIRTLCSFIIGLPGETCQTVQESIQFAIELETDDAGFSIATPFPGTEMRRWAEQNGYLLPHTYDMLTLSRSVMRTEALTCQELEGLKREAIETFARTVLRRSCGKRVSWLDVEERSCREALAAAVARADGVGQAMIRSRLARLRLDSGDNRKAIDLLRQAVAEPNFYDYDRTRALVLLSIALRRDSQRDLARVALSQAIQSARPSHMDWIRRETSELGTTVKELWHTGGTQRSLSARLKAIWDR